MRSIAVNALIAVAAFCAYSNASLAQTAYPTKPIRIIATLSGGSQVDILTRVLADKLSVSMKQPVIVENRVGAGGTIATAAVASAPADGYTLLATTNAFAINPSLYKKLPFNSQQSFAGVSLIGVVPSVLIAAPNKSFKNLPAFIAAAKAKPGTLTYATAGVGTGSHLAMEMLRDLADIDLLHVPYKGTPEAIADLMSGRIDVSMGPVGATAALLRDGRAVALAVTTRERSPFLPSVPTFAESGVGGYRFDFWYGFLAPAGTPTAVLDKLAAEVSKALALPDVRTKFAEQSVMLTSIATPLTTTMFDQFIAAEITRYAALVRKSGASAD
jgi:tripartite-type tricarboxylate transporter receptor subunit TctC